jgi:hypothetical protein
MNHPRSQTPFGNALRETPYHENVVGSLILAKTVMLAESTNRETEFPVVRSQTEFGNEELLPLTVMIFPMPRLDGVGAATETGNEGP